jgi:hypothetical protein
MTIMSSYADPVEPTTQLNESTINQSECLLELRYASCIVHKMECCIGRKVAMLNVSGTICTGHSAMGLNERDTAMTWAYFLVWCGLRRLAQEPLIIQECVDSFPREKMAALLPMYDLSWHVLSPHHYGWPVKRVRQWCV